jgi:threonine synthase
MIGPAITDEEIRKLIIQLLTRAGMLMEDASAVAILSAGSHVELASCIREATKSCGTAMLLLESAASLLDDAAAGRGRSQRRR